MNKVTDEFTDLKVSREMKRQLRRMKRGLCVKCNNPICSCSKYFCAEHTVSQREYARKIKGSVRRNTNCASYGL